MKIALWITLGLAALALAVLVAGALSPANHRAARRLLLDSAPERVYALLADIDAYPTWRPGITSVNRTGDRTYREEGSFGPIVYALEVDEAPRRRVIRIADPELPFGGTWTFELAPTENGGTLLRITEDGVVRNLLFRAFSRFVFGHTKTIDEYLAATAKRLGESARPEPVEGP